MPNMAVDTAKNERWYQLITESSRVSRISMHSVAAVVRNRPRRNQEREWFMGGAPAGARRPLPHQRDGLAWTSPENSTPTPRSSRGRGPALVRRDARRTLSPHRWTPAGPAG